jgi:hypothetical protein
MRLYRQSDGCRYARDRRRAGTPSPTSPSTGDYMNKLFRLGRERALANAVWLPLDEVD